MRNRALGSCAHHSGATGIAVPGAIVTEANGINNAGQIVGQYAANGTGYGFLYDNGVYTTLAIPADYVFAEDINDSGQIVGFYDNFSNNTEYGFLATPTHGVPGPIAGAGLPGLILATGWSSRLVATAAETRLIAISRPTCASRDDGGGACGEPPPTAARPEQRTTFRHALQECRAPPGPLQWPAVTPCHAEVAYHSGSPCFAQTFLHSREIFRAAEAGPIP